MTSEHARPAGTEQGDGHQITYTIDRTGLNPCLLTILAAVVPRLDDIVECGGLRSLKAESAPRRLPGVAGV